MVLNLIIALALAPAAVVLRTPRLDWIVAMVAYEVIALPVIIMLIVVASVDPGRKRDTIIILLCLTPVIVLVGIALVLWIRERLIEILSGRAHFDIHTAPILIFSLSHLFVMLSPKWIAWIRKIRGERRDVDMQRVEREPDSSELP